MSQYSSVIAVPVYIDVSNYIEWGWGWDTGSSDNRSRGTRVKTG